jgi:hypothetical protein
MQVGNRIFVWAMVLTLASLTLGWAEARAEEEKPGDVAEVWMVWPKSGHEPEFENALKNYAAWRKQAGEAFNWQAFQPIVGDDLTHFVYRSGDHHWKDFDANQAWVVQAKATEKFNEMVGPHAARVEHYFVVVDRKHSYWIDSADYRYFGVSRLQLRPGAYGQMVEALGKIHKAAVDGDWNYGWAIGNIVGGNGGMQVVFPYKSFADMAEPDPSFMQVLAKSLGSEEAARGVMKQLGSSFEGERYTVYTPRPDLSTPR